MSYDNCNECKFQKGCPLVQRSENYKRKVCSFLKLGPVHRDEGHKDYNVELMAERLLLRLNVIKQMVHQNQGTDYSRDDTGNIAERFDPNLN